jgi:V/A-type H+-transporting ATPase subunit I
MAVLKMKLVNIVGLVPDFDRVINQYVLDKEINLENAIEVLNNVRGLYPCIGENRYQGDKASFEGFFDLIGAERPEIDYAAADYQEEEIQKMIGTITDKISKSREDIQKIDKTIQENSMLLESLEYVRDVDVPLGKLFSFQFMKFRFGKLPKVGYKTLETYLGDLEAFFIITHEERDFVWGMYFTPAGSEDKVDALFSSLYFQRVHLSGQLTDTPAKEYAKLTEAQQKLKQRRGEIELSMRNTISAEYPTICGMYQSILKKSFLEKFKGYCAHTKDSFYVVGWMSEQEISKLKKQTEPEENVMVVVEDPEDVVNAKPPTKMHNWAIFKPFETLVRMYGLPSYNEVDPTAFLAITYFLMFGIMFGDVGQGLVLILAGLLFYKWKKVKLGAVAATIGVSSVAFGFVYGSFFGNEEILPFHLIKPMDSINQMLLYSVVFGVVLILAAMVINIINGIKNHDKGKIFVGQNSIAGMIFYVAVLLVVLKMMTGTGLSASPVVIILFIAAPLIVILLQEPLTRLLAHYKDWKPKQPGMFLLESFFELFEVVLSFITNTLSFLRVGAFAMNHAGMMMVVYLLGDMMGGGASIPVLVIGNIFVMCMEGFIVAIQILRLEFYEMFSRFFGGDGIEFRSIKSQLND